MSVSRPAARSRRAVRLPEHVEQRERDGDDDGAEHEAEDAEDLQAAEHGEEDEQLVQPRPLADELRAQEVVDACR